MSLFLRVALLFLNHAVLSQDLPILSLDQLHTYADACNNEGGQVAACLNERQQWGCFHILLDRPLIDRHTLADLNASNKFLLKESMIAEYREERVNQACLLILSYLVDHLRSIASLGADEPAQLTVHVHRRSSGIAQINTLLIPMLHEFYYGALQTELLEVCEVLSKDPEDYRIKLTLPPHTGIIFRNGYHPKTFKDYEDSHFTLSLGLVMGLNPQWSSGTLLLPEDFIPTDEVSGYIYESQRYQKKNSLKDYLSAIIADTDRQQKVINIIHSNPAYHSPNPDKPFQSLLPLTLNDFHAPQILQILTLWSPKIGDPDLKIVK